MDGMQDPEGFSIGNVKVGLSHSKKNISLTIGINCHEWELPSFSAKLEAAHRVNCIMKYLKDESIIPLNSEWEIFVFVYSTKNKTQAL